jgi:hypothetical protein
MDVDRHHVMVGVESVPRPRHAADGGLSRSVSCFPPAARGGDPRRDRPRVVTVRMALWAAVVACLAIDAPRAAAGDLARVLRRLAAPLEAAHREPPPPPCDDPLDRLVAQAAWLDHHQRTHGWIVPKEPDVWGQTRLMRHRAEYEAEMVRQIGQFSERTSAALRRSDQAFLGMALALQSASGNRRSTRQVAVPEATGSASVVNSIQGLLPTTNEPVDRAPPVVIARSGPFAFTPAPPGFRFDDEAVALEPTVHLDQLSRYLQHLHALRRVNEGDDSADAPGYELALVRIPVSVTPGERTDSGHGAEITFTAEPVLGDDLLPTTFRSLVINDLVDVIAPPLTWCVNDPACVAWAARIVGGDEASGAAIAAGPEGLLLPGDAPPPPARPDVMDALEALSARLPTVSPAPAPAMKTRRARLPITFSQLVEVSGTREIAILIHETHRALAGHPVGRPCVTIIDVRGFLDEEAKAAAAFLEEESRRHVWAEMPAWNLAALVRGRRTAELDALRCRFFADVGAADDAARVRLTAAGAAVPGGSPANMPGIVVAPAATGHGMLDPRCCLPGPPPPPACATPTAVLAWGLLVESALLEERLVDDMQESATSRGQGARLACGGPFYGPDPPRDARQAFNDYVRRRWPLRVFALDPVREEQNVDDSFARRREMQIALAVATASGRLNAQALTRYTRRLETDMATVALNQTAVGFAHGSDTFGWRFYPRVQTPPTRGTLATLGETIRGGPTTDAERSRQRLEPGMRECTAIVVMPSFVPFVRFDSTARFFALAHPRAADPTLRTMLECARAVQAMRHTQAEVVRRACDPGDDHAAIFLRQVDQLERRLPLQSLVAHVPHENTAGGFELFATGISDLAPELVGWFGSPGIDAAAATTLFLVGKGFSVHDTRVIAGGRPAAFRLLSRDVLEVTIPAGVMTLRDTAACGAATAARLRPGAVVPAAGVETLPGPPPVAPAQADATEWPDADCNHRETVDIHVATPYGVSGHLLVPVVRGAAADDVGTLPAFEAACTIRLTFAATRATGSTAVQARVDEYYGSDCESIAIRVPRAFVPPAKAGLSLVLRDAATGETAATLTFPDPFFDARGRRYLVAGGDLRNLVGDTSRPATDKTLRGAVKPWLDRLLQRGRLTEPGAEAALTLSAAIVAGQQVVPVEGGLTVICTRRGPTATEPREASPAPDGGD